MHKHYLADIIEPVVESLDFSCVRILSIGDSNQTLQVMIEHKDYQQEVTVEDCAKVSRAISAVLDEKDPIAERYTLEVSSPGLDRPLTKAEHFKRYVGYVIKLETIETVDKRKRFKGEIMQANDNTVTLKMDNTEYQIAFENVAKAKIVITDELWAEYLKAHKTTQA
ncbi:MAG: ribosome maturation factor RimP [Alphaproteobacteria bacterium]|nr:ribosome maturation factor RimP [Alphaproteobacteria bacterium]